VTLNVVALEPHRHIVATGDSGFYRAEYEGDEIGALGDGLWPWPKVYFLTWRVLAACAGLVGPHAEFSRAAMQRITDDDGIDAVEAVIPDVLAEVAALDPQGYVELPFGLFQRGSVFEHFNLSLAGFRRDGSVRLINCVDGEVEVDDDTTFMASLPHGVEEAELAPLLPHGHTTGLQDTLRAVVEVHEQMHARRPDRVPPQLHGAVMFWRGRKPPAVVTFSLDVRDDAARREILSATRLKMIVGGIRAARDRQQATTEDRPPLILGADE
jgi:hypothetical protein